MRTCTAALRRISRGVSSAVVKLCHRVAFRPICQCPCAGHLPWGYLRCGDTDVADGQRPYTAEVSDVLGEDQRMARNVQPILALAVLPAMATWHSPRSRRPQALSRWTLIRIRNFSP